MFFKKKDINEVVLMHYEGLIGFKQDFPCKAFIEDENVLFKNDTTDIRLSYNQINNIDYMPETNFMGKYHNNPVNTSETNAVKWFSVITYTSSSGETKYIAFWSVDSKGRKFFEKVEQNIPHKKVVL
ncbi:MAG: hypothetical protein IJ518_04195 [Clostridia bacterium]|nr:hypothetical protein [Clostridia bacterium]